MLRNAVSTEGGGLPMRRVSSGAIASTHANNLRTPRYQGINGGLCLVDEIYLVPSSMND